MEYFKKVTGDDILVKCIDKNNNYSIASKKDPEPDYFTRRTFHEQANQKDRGIGWEQITAEEASEILGYDVTE